MEKVEFLILRNLLYNEEYVRKVVPFLKAEYFENFNEKVVFEEILNFVQEYNGDQSCPKRGCSEERACTSHAGESD